MAMQTNEAADAAGTAPAAPGHEAAAAGAHEGAAGAGAHEAKGGLPQFDFAWWPGQIAWFLIIFFLVLAFVRFFAAPKVGGTIELREGQIAGDIADARRMKDEADAQAAAAAAETAQARAAAQKVGAEARAKSQAAIAARLAQEEAKLAASGAEAEARIGAARDAAMGNVHGIAADAAKAIVEKLTGRAVTATELTAAQSARG
jgi:F-type H+-transporting ATPase subunit b